MIYITYLIGITLNLFQIILRKRSTVVNVLSIVLISIIMLGNTYNPDYNGYAMWYKNQNYPVSWGWGYIVLAHLFNELSLSYHHFVTFLLMIAMSIQVYVVTRYTREYHCVILAYMAFTMFLDIVQVRNFFMVALWMLALTFLARKKRVAYLLTVLVAILFHTSAVVLLVFVILTPHNKLSRDIVVCELFFVYMLCIITFLNENRIPFIAEIAKVFLGKEMEDKLVYFNTATNWGFLTSFICHFINVYLAKISNEYVHCNSKEFKNKHIKYDIKDFADLVYQVILVSSFALPLVMMNSNFTRYFRMCNVLLYILVAVVVEIYQENKYRGQKTSIYLFGGIRGSISFYVCIVIANWGIWILLKQDWTSVMDVLTYNMFGI